MNGAWKAVPGYEGYKYTVIMIHAITVKWSKIYHHQTRVRMLIDKNGAQIGLEINGAFCRQNKHFGDKILLEQYLRYEF